MRSGLIRMSEILMTDTNKSDANDKTESKNKNLRVLDKTAIHGKRIHELPNGKGGYDRHTFEPDTYLTLPPHAASPLIGNDAFVVETSDGIVLRPIVETVGRGEGEAKITLSPDQVIASLDELTKDALYLRARNAGVGEGLHPIKTPREELISVVLRARTEVPETIATAGGKGKGKGKGGDDPGPVDAPGASNAVLDPDPYA